MIITYDKSQKKYYLDDIPYSKEEFISYIDSDMLQSTLSNKSSSLDINDNEQDQKNELNNVSRKKTGRNILLYGVPGSGKSHAINEKYCNDSTRLERVVFHPDYTYSDFVGQIMPNVDNNELKYIFTPGPFTKLLKKAWNNPNYEYFLIIEEINRGNAPAVFGEIFQLLDRKSIDNNMIISGVGESEYGITNYDIAQEVYGEAEHEIKIPSNMWVLATMNTSDQNVFTLDTAFQRRWNMRHIKNDVLSTKHANSLIEGTEISWGAFASIINERILDVNSELSGIEDKRLGAYFVSENELTIDQFPEKVLKYLWDDAFKMNRYEVFKEDMLSLDMVLETFEMSNNDKLQSVLNGSVYAKMLVSMPE